jgi:glycerophosphoryl diester phosphodiesterase
MAPLIIAHRGDSAHRPENTLASFASALEQGADLVELDVQLTKDGPCVIHYPTLDRTTSGKGKVGERSLAELRGLSAGYPERFGSSFAGERVPTLAEALALLRGRARVMIEIKRESVSDDADGGVEALTAAVVRQAAMEKDVALISFERRVLLRCRDLAPAITRGHLFYREEPDAVVAGAREIGSDLVMPEGDAHRRAEAPPRAGLKLATWVVDGRAARPRASTLRRGLEPPRRAARSHLEANRTPWDGPRGLWAGDTEGKDSAEGDV